PQASSHTEESGLPIPWHEVVLDLGVSGPLHRPCHHLVAQFVVPRIARTPFFHSPLSSSLMSRSFNKMEWKQRAGMLQSLSWPPSDPDCFRCEFVSFGGGLPTCIDRGRGWRALG